MSDPTSEPPLDRRALVKQQAAGWKATGTMTPAERVTTWAGSLGVLMVSLGFLLGRVVNPAYDLTAGEFGDDAKAMNWSLFSQWAVGGVIVIIVGMAGATVARTIEGQTGKPTSPRQVDTSGDNAW